MPVYERETRVHAPLSEVWDFHSRVSGLEALTPAWMNLTVEHVVDAAGDPDPEVLETGSQIQLSSRPFGVGPRQRFVSRIVEREKRDGSAYFVDDMQEGPTEHWEHTHSFFADGDETVVRDRVEFRLGGTLGRAVGPLAVVGFEPMFRYRHRKTRELLE